MSFPVPDDYAGLVAPWKPIAEYAIKNGSSIHARIQIDRGIKEGDLAETKNNNAITGSGDGHQHKDMETAGIDDLDNNMTFNDGPQEASDMENSGLTESGNIDIDVSVGNGCQNAGAEVTDTDNDESQHVDTECVAVPTCVANSEDHRKVVSHIFGRNKACTRKLPKHLWVYWCRKHYQRFKYRGEEAENWHMIQLGLVRNQLETFENWGEVHTWTIDLRKSEKNALAEENKNRTTYTNYASSCWERFLVPYLGSNKSFAQIREVLKVIEGKFNEPEYLNRDKKLKTFPGVEFLPNNRTAKEIKKPRAKKGETTYKKITLDQPAFKRRTDANKQYIKKMAAVKGEASNTPKSSTTASEKDKSPDTTNDSFISAKEKRQTPTTENAPNDSANRKRKFVNITTATVTPSSFKITPAKRKPMATLHKALQVQSSTSKAPTKRRRLTRGYDKHGSDSEDTSFMNGEENYEE